MSDLTPEERLTKHQAVAAWLEYQLGQERQKIRELEKEIVEQERRRKIAHIESRFRIEHTWGDEDPDIMHRGGCRKNRDPGQLIQAPQAAVAMRDRHIVGCEICNPIPALQYVYLVDPVLDEGA